MLRKKYVVQKSFRIDDDLESDLALLAELTNRSQNDLVNLSIKDFLLENKNWFLQAAIIEYFSEVLEYGNDAPEKPFSMQGLTIKLITDDEDKIKCIFKREINGEIIDEGEDEYKGLEGQQKLRKALLSYGVYLNAENEEAQKYLDNRLNYTDYVTI